MKVSTEEKRRIRNGDIPCIKQVLSRELEDTKNSLLSFRATSAEYDNVLKGKGMLLKELLDLLSE